MKMKKINSEKLRAIGYDARARCATQLGDGSTLQYGGVDARILGAVSAVRGRHGASIANIGEEFAAKRISGSSWGSHRQ